MVELAMPHILNNLRRSTTTGVWMCLTFMELTHKCIGITFWLIIYSTKMETKSKGEEENRLD